MEKYEKNDVHMAMLMLVATPAATEWKERKERHKPQSLLSALWS